MNLQTTAADIPLQITSENASAERRITPSWTIAHLKTKLEPVTGIPPSAQQLSLKLPDQKAIAIEAEDEESVQVVRFPLQAYAEIYVTDSRPPSSRLHIPSASTVPKYTMPTSEYANRTDSVLAWKKTHQLGRFDPHGADAARARLEKGERETRERGISIGSRCRLSPSNRRGKILYIGAIPTLPGAPGSAWIGIALDEPVGKNDGSVGGTRYFECGPGCGVFVRPERVEVGDWAVVEDWLDVEEGEGEGEGDMEEI